MANLRSTALLISGVKNGAFTHGLLQVFEIAYEKSGGDGIHEDGLFIKWIAVLDR
jgi:hypothetical protein